MIGTTSSGTLIVLLGTYVLYVLQAGLLRPGGGVALDGRRRQVVARAGRSHRRTVVGPRLRPRLARPPRASRRSLVTGLGQRVQVLLFLGEHLGWCPPGHPMLTSVDLGHPRVAGIGQLSPDSWRARLSILRPRCTTVDISSYVSWLQRSQVQMPLSSGLPVASGLRSRMAE